MTKDYLKNIELKHEVHEGMENHGAWGGWGSSQYDDAKNQYDTYFILRAEGKSMKEAVIIIANEIENNEEDFSNFPETLTLAPFESFLSVLKEENLEKDFELECPEEFEEMEEELETITNGDEAFQFLANQSWDLWSAAFYVEDVFEESLGFGGNESYTGLSCALMKEYGFIKDEKSFTNFST